jgi:hypothetical protein
VANGLVLGSILFPTGLSVPFGIRLPCGTPGGLRALPRAGEHGVEEVHVGVHRLLGESLGGLLLLALLLDEVLGQGAVVLGLGPEVVDHAVEEVLGELRVELLGGNRTVGESLVGFGE